MIGVFGGTFDPIHLGHLRPVLEVHQALQLERTHFIPCRIPVHRTPPLADASTRLAMVRLAVEQVQGFVADDRELTRQSPSYMVDTLASLQRDFPADSLCLLLGADAFAQFKQWKSWRRILQLANLLVMRRPLAEPLDLAADLSARVTAEQHVFRASRAGRILFFDVTLMDISATQVRQAAMEGKAIRYWVTDKVCEFIADKKLYESK